MYYSSHCPYCNRIFYVYASDKTTASQSLYAGIKQHLIDYDEDRKEHKLDDGPDADSAEIYNEMIESSEPPSGGYPLK